MSLVLSLSSKKLFAFTELSNCQPQPDRSQNGGQRFTMERTGARWQACPDVIAFFMQAPPPSPPSKKHNGLRSQAAHGCTGTTIGLPQATCFGESDNGPDSVEKKPPTGPTRSDRTYQKPLENQHFSWENHNFWWENHHFSWENHHFSWENQRTFCGHGLGFQFAGQPPRLPAASDGDPVTCDDSSPKMENGMKMVV